jgi:PhoPQ-activated pathogenicity-related protein
MRARYGRWVAALGAAMALAGAAWGSLATFVSKPDAEFSWSKEAESGEAVKSISLKVRSQVWRGIPWDHQVRIYLPAKSEYPKTAFLFITGGNPSPTDALLYGVLAQKLGAPLAILYNIPNQPLYDGKVEDDLIAHTFEEYLKSGDDTWPLLQPMVKSAIRTMDAIQALSKKEWATPVEDFVVSGASKRGWTTYLTGATDRRVRAIAPMVFNNLKFSEQMPRQLAQWGAYSEQIEDYSRRGLQQQLNTPRGKELTQMVDPWYYRKQLTMPKLLIHGANDRYWVTDATDAYWKELEGKKYLLTVPNSGHGLEDKGRVINTLVAFFRAQAGGKPFPELSASQREQNRDVTVTGRSSVKPIAVRAWLAKADDLDFRPVKWQEMSLKQDGESFHGKAIGEARGGMAVFVEAEYEMDGQKFTLTTPPQVYGGK